jgi:hypothetical protein
MKSRLSLFLVLGAALALAGCNNRRIVLCPSAAILADTAVETVFRPGAPAELSGEAFTAYLVSSSSDCTFDQAAGQTKSSLDLKFRAVRPPSPDAATYTVPYFIAVNQAERLISKQMMTVQFQFAPGATVATADESQGYFPVTLERGHQPDEYEILFGFQLTDAQRAYNQKMGPYLP